MGKKNKNKTSEKVNNIEPVNEKRLTPQFREISGAVANTFSADGSQVPA